MKKTFYFSALFFLIFHFQSHAQISAGVYRLSSETFAAIGTDPDNKIFGEARVSTGSTIGIEGTFGYNFIQRDEVNFYSGFHLGNRGNRDGIYLGVPLGVLIKPFSETRNFVFFLEASPIFMSERGRQQGERGRNYFRAGLGLKYTFR